MVQGGGWRRERAASPSTRAADSIARPSSLLLRVVLAMRAAAVTRWWRACGREGRDCGLTAATSARPVCAVRCGRELKSDSHCSLRTAGCELRAGTCVWTHGIARQCANVSQMIQQPKVTLYPATGSPRGAVHRGPTLHTALTAQALHAGEETRVRTSSLLHSTPRPSTGSRSEATAAAFPATGSPPPRHCCAADCCSSLSWRGPRGSKKKIAQSSLPRVLTVKLPSLSDHPPPCSMQVQPIVTTRISTVVASQAEQQQRSG